jgi:hypothetical protein
MSELPRFDIYSIGRSISALGERGQNISFLRLVGVSSPNGVSFLYENVVSRSGLDQMAERIRVATGTFYDQYVKPTGAHIMVTTDIRRTSE